VCITCPGPPTRGGELLKLVGVGFEGKLKVLLLEAVGVDTGERFGTVSKTVFNL